MVSDEDIRFFLEVAEGYATSVAESNSEDTNRPKEVADEIRRRLGLDEPATGDAEASK